MIDQVTGFEIKDEPEMVPMEKVKVLIEVLQFYAEGNHFNHDGSECGQNDEPENPSGEPINIQCGHGDYTLEDGSYARLALAKFYLKPEVVMK